MKMSVEFVKENNFNETDFWLPVLLKVSTCLLQQWHIFYVCNAKPSQYNIVATSEVNCDIPITIYGQK